MATTFKEQLVENMHSKITELRAEGITAMGMENLMMVVTPPPSHLPGSINGTNNGYYYAELFRELANSSPKVRRFLCVVALAFLGLGASAQSVVRDSTGNYHERATVRAEVVDSATTYTYTYDHGTQTYTLPVWRGPKGGLYVWKLDGKLGIQRKVYLPKQ